MLLAGTGGHALELIDIFLQNNPHSVLHFFNELSPQLYKDQVKSYPILRTDSEVSHLFRSTTEFCVAVGSPLLRERLYFKMKALGGKATHIIASSAQISQEIKELGEGANVMHGVFISAHCRIGVNVLFNTHSSIHHGVIVGDHCEISPGARVLGNAIIGSKVSIGSNAVILPGIELGDEAIVGAGAVVTKNVPPGKVVKGVPAV
ncbi:MAG: NeuD/PglB/VioB family sugar acetyltransferase [Flavobacteriales bacterium]|nr:NeuD/PglB/VioB family sugar acetyltransferase [Flavobacteriales bacterium]